MTETEVTGALGGDFKLHEVREALASSSTSVRTAQLRVVNERLSQEGKVLAMAFFLEVPALTPSRR